MMVDSFATVVIQSLRSNTFGVCVALARAGLVGEVLCRKYKYKSVTLGHVLGECYTHKGKRIHRRNELAELIVEHCYKKGFPVDREASMVVDGERLILDLIIETQLMRFVVDISVRFENEDSLERAAREKIDKYSKLKIHFCDIR